MGFAGVGAGLGDLHADLGGLEADGVGEGESLGAHDEAEDAAACAAAEAVEHLFFGGHAEGA